MQLMLEKLSLKLGQRFMVNMCLRNGFSEENLSREKSFDPKITTYSSEISETDNFRFKPEVRG